MFDSVSNLQPSCLLNLGYNVGLKISPRGPRSRSFSGFGSDFMSVTFVTAAILNTWIVSKLKRQACWHDAALGEQQNTYRHIVSFKQHDERGFACVVL